MATGEEKQAPAGAFWSELFHTGQYKANQGQIARRATFAAIAITFGVGAWRLSQEVQAYAWFKQWSQNMGVNLELLALGFAGLLVLLPGVWLAYRLVNMPRFADFLISVEAEMAKVSWPSKPELFRAVLVVLVTVLILATLLFVFDFVWNQLFNALGIRGGVMGGG